MSRSKVVHRTVLYLGEINDSQQSAWRKTLEVFDEDRRVLASLSLFPEDRELPADAVDGVQVKLSEMRVERPRTFGGCWLGCELWRQLKLDEFWQARLPEGREGVPWEKVLRLLVVNRLIEPGSEFRVHRHWFDQTAMAELLAVNFAVAEKDRLYRCLDRILAHKAELFQHLRLRWQDLFAARFDLLLYDLTSTYVEGEAEAIPKARHGYSRDGRFDCRQVVIALVLTPEGFPLAYEVMEGNTSDRNSLRGFLDKIESVYGKARRVWMMDRGVPSEELLAEMRTPGREMFYLVGTPRGKIRQYEAKWTELPWRKVRESVEVKLFAEEGELYVLAKSAGRQAKEMAIRRRKLARLLWRLRALRRVCPTRDALLMKIGAAKSEAGRAFGFVKISVPKAQEEVTRQTFQFRLERSKLEEAERRDGHYLLRTNLTGENPEVLWDRYMQLAQIEAAFKCLKSELGIRPIYHQIEHRVRGPHPHCLSGVRLVGDAETASAGPRSGPDAESGAGEAGGHADARCVFPDHGWAPISDAPLHRADTRTKAPVARTAARAPHSATAQDHGPAGNLSCWNAAFVGQTLAMPVLKRSELTQLNTLKCESSVSPLQSPREGLRLYR